MRQRQELNNVLIYEKTVKALRVQQDTIVKGIDTIIEEWRYEVRNQKMEKRYTLLMGIDCGYIDGRRIFAINTVFVLYHHHLLYYYSTVAFNNQ